MKTARMADKLKDYQVLDVLCGGTFYKVKHKVTNNIFAWKAYDCSAYSDEQIQNIVNEVKTISKVISGNLLRYYDTILHGASKTLYFVLEYNSWQSLHELILICKAADKYFSESFIWYLLLELARACKAVEKLNFTVILKCISPASVFVDGSGEVRINCFDLQSTTSGSSDLVRQIGDVIETLCDRPELCDGKLSEVYYSDDLIDVISFLTDDKNASLRPDVLLYHPTVLANLEVHSRPKHLTEVIVAIENSQKSEVNKCDSEKAVDMCKIKKHSTRASFNHVDIPIYANTSPERDPGIQSEDFNLTQSSLSPTLAALALELPGYVPRSRKPYNEALDTYNCAQRVSEETFTNQWLARLMAIRQREQSLNKRERELITKEIVHSPTAKIIANENSNTCESNGITLPPLVTQISEGNSKWAARRRRRRSNSIRNRVRRKSYSYEDLDSSLSADTGDGSIIVTATKFTKENMPRRNIFSELSSKRVHFTQPNPFVESDESVTLTFYDVEDTVSTQHNKSVKDITQFKYLDLEKVISEKRNAVNWGHSSPSKQSKIGDIFADITNHGGLRKTPSKTSLTSRSSLASRSSMKSAKSYWSMESNDIKVSEGYVSDRTRSSLRQYVPQTPTAPPELKKNKSRKSLLHFRTPFKFKSSTKV